MKNTLKRFESLIRTVRTLRGANGCPWDRRQTTDSLKKYLVEELEEIVEAIDNNDSTNLCEELGDFFYLIVMLSEINREGKTFSLQDVLQGADEKLIRRHPHVFSDACITDETALRKQWERIKREEKAKKNS